MTLLTGMAIGLSVAYLIYRHGFASAPEYDSY